MQRPVTTIRGERLSPTIYDYYPKSLSQVLGIVQLICGILLIIIGIAMIFGAPIPPYAWQGSLTVRALSLSIYSKDCPITAKGHRGVTGFCARHLSVSQLRDDGAYHLSVATLPSPVPKEGSCPFERPGWPVEPNQGCQMASTGLLTTTLYYTASLQINYGTTPLWLLDRSTF